MPLRVNELVLESGGAKNYTGSNFDETGRNGTVLALINRIGAK